MALALFIRPDDTMLQSYVESNYDQNQLRALIYDVQQMKILTVIGTGLYAELETQITANTLTALNTTLLEKIRPALRMYVLSMGMEVFNYKIRNKGVQTQSSENAQPVGLNELDRLIRKYDDMAQVYADRIKNYLLENTTSYPLYSNPGTGVDIIHPDGNTYSVGLYLGRGGYNCRIIDRDESIY
mgnify:CR=1 FL=1